jgi:hypothetical protein
MWMIVSPAQHLTATLDGPGDVPDVAAASLSEGRCGAVVRVHFVTVMIIVQTAALPVPLLCWL